MSKYTHEQTITFGIHKDDIKEAERLVKEIEYKDDYYSYSAELDADENGGDLYIYLKGVGDEEPFCYETSWALDLLKGYDIDPTYTKISEVESIWDDEDEYDPYDRADYEYDRHRYGDDRYDYWED